jgi:Predicted Zn-dependent protease
MKINITTNIPSEAEKAILKLSKKFKRFEAKKLNILIKESTNKRALKDMEGVGGYCPAPDFIQISIDPDHRKFKTDPTGAVLRSFAHELYHSIRFNTGVSRPKGTMLDCLIDEGLADQFVSETTGRLPIWNKRYSPVMLKKLLKRFSKIADNKVTKRLYNDWFIKGSKRGIPRWIGYSLGLHIVRTYQQKHKRVQVIKLISISSDEIFNDN